MDNPPRPLSVHIPVTLVALALAVFFASQIGAANRSVETIKWQLKNFETQLTSIKENQKKLADSASQRGELVKQASTVQEQYTKLLNDVIDLAENDKDAAQVVAKYKIQRTQPPAAAEDKPAEEPKKDGGE